jgi:S-adenosylmethionine:tRNA ribosyltransferase-isomerase
VLNDTRVVPARFWLRRTTGGRLEALFLHAIADGTWQVLLKGGGRLRQGERLRAESTRLGGTGDAVSPMLATPRQSPIPEGMGHPHSEFEFVGRSEGDEWSLRPRPPVDAVAWLAQHGEVPLPPYIRRETGPEAGDDARYQTVYAARAGAVAAPTAGLHFTPELLAQVAAAGVRRVDVTLHVGAGTFQPVETADLRDHRMHAEWYEVPPASRAALAATRAAHSATGAGLAAIGAARGRIIAVGTTAARVLETLPDLTIADPSADTAAPSAGGAGLRGWTQAFIYPPYRFRHVDALVTNFHLPGSTLLALVMALAGVELTRTAYATAVAERYRFYSYGDAMLVL